MIVLKDIQIQELEGILSYIYLGEANVLRDSLPALLEAAESLKIKGLAVQENEPNLQKVSESEEKRKNSESFSSPPSAKKKKPNPRNDEVQAEKIFSSNNPRLDKHTSKKSPISNDVPFLPVKTENLVDLVSILLFTINMK